MEHEMDYYLVIEYRDHPGQYARLGAESLDCALALKIQFENWGLCKTLRIENNSTPEPV